MPRKRVIIVGAAGRDFHNFNTCFRDDPDSQVVCFTAAQIPDIDGRAYPPKLAGPLYPEGIPIEAEEDLEALIRRHRADEVVFAYSDVSHEHVMHMACRAQDAGADFRLIGPKRTMLRSNKPVSAITAVRTGAGKSQTTRRIAQILKERKVKMAVARHPMPYGDLTKQEVQRFRTIADMRRHNCTIEEMEEYEPHLRMGTSVFAGVDYGKILAAMEKEAQVLLWDGGNNDTPFFEPDLHIVVADPHRPGHEMTYYPGETNLRRADLVIINKVDSAPQGGADIVRNNATAVNEDALIVEAASPIFVDKPNALWGKKALVVEDGPTLTHGEMKYGAGVLAARKWGARELIDPRPYVKGTIAETFEKYPKIGPLLPAMGYGEEQMQDLEETINAVPCDVVVIGTPIDLSRIIDINKPSVRVRYELQEIGHPNLWDVIDGFLKKHMKKGRTK
jgi:predicted GTPase